MGQALSGKMRESRRLSLCFSCQGIRQNVPYSEIRLPACSDWLVNEWRGGFSPERAVEWCLLLYFRTELINPVAQHSHDQSVKCKEFVVQERDKRVQILHLLHIVARRICHGFEISLGSFACLSPFFPQISSSHLCNCK